MINFFETWSTKQIGKELYQSVRKNTVNWEKILSIGKKIRSIEKKIRSIGKKIRSIGKKIRDQITARVGRLLMQVMEVK